MASAAEVVRTPSATIFMLCTISASCRPRASSMPTCRLRLNEPVQVSTRSPSPLRPDGVSRRPPAATRQSCDLSKAARDERRERVVPEPRAFDDPSGNRDDVLQRATQFDADDIVRPIEPEVTAAELRLDTLGCHRVV